jgi:hypothetical protein
MIQWKDVDFGITKNLITQGAISAVSLFVDRRLGERARGYLSVNNHKSDVLQLW